MTLTDAINILKNEKPHCGRKIRYTEGDICEAFDMAIKALEQEDCEDAVSRDLMTNTLGATCIAKRDEKGNLVALCSIDNLPSVNPKSKTGRWIDGVCSECGYIGDEEVFGGKFKYCPVCGAVMRGEHENN